MEYLADVGVSILIFAALGLSLNLLVGYTGQVSLAHAVFYGLGAYAVGLLTLPSESTGTEVARGVTSGAGWPFIPAVIVGVLFATAAALVIAIPALRVTGEYVILLTLAFQVVANQLMNTLSSITGGPYGLTPIPPPDLLGWQLTTPQATILLMLLVVIGFVALTWWIGLSPFGRILRGIREDEEAVAALGKNPTASKVMIFAVAAGLAGLVGGISAAYYSFIAPGNYSLDVSIFLVAIVVLGGSGNVTGVLIGALVLGGLQPVLQNVVGDRGIVWQSVIYGLGLAAVMFLRPSGVFPEATGLDRLIKNRVYDRLVEWQGIGRAASSVSETPGELARTEARAGQNSEGAGGRSDDANPVLRGVGLSKSFAGLKAVEGVDIELPRGQVTGLVGPNGAGKTTLFNLLTGTLKADTGQVFLGPDEVTGDPIDALARRGLVRSFQDVRVFEQLTALDNVAMAVPDQPGENPLQLIGRPLMVLRSEALTLEKAREALKFVGIERLADEVVVDLSFGDQKLVAIARVVATEADVLLLDEPTSGVDPSRVEEITELVLRLRDSGRTICIVEHSVHLIEQLADQVVFLDDGRVLARGPMDELTRQDHLVEIYFGT